MVLLLALVATMPGVANSATALIVGGAGKYAVLTEEQMAAALGGRFKDYTRVNVPFPGLPDDLRYSLDVGTENLHAAVYATPGPKTIGGVSEGAPVVDEVLRRLMNDPNPPPAGELNAVMLGTMSPIWYLFTGVDYRPVADTRYDVMVVKAEYDGIADWPDNWINVLAVANAVLGALQLHVSSAFYDISLVPPEYVARKTNSEGGTTTTVLIPTPLLPLLKPLADAGASQETIDCLDGVIRPIIDSGYWRFWFKDRSSGWPLPPPERRAPRRWTLRFRSRAPPAMWNATSAPDSHRWLIRNPTSRVPLRPTTRRPNRPTTPQCNRPTTPQCDRPTYRHRVMKRSGTGNKKMTATPPRATVKSPPLVTMLPLPNPKRTRASRRRPTRPWRTTARIPQDPAPRLQTTRQMQ